MGEAARKQRQSQPPTPIRRELAPPQNIEAEQAVLGGLLQPGRRQKEISETLFDVVSAGDFFAPAHRLIFESALEDHRAGRTPDMLGIAERLTRAGQDYGGPAYIAELVTGVVSLAHCEHHARIVRERAVERSMITLAHEIEGQARDSSRTVLERLDEAGRRVLELSGLATVQEAVSLGSLSQGCLTAIQARADRPGECQGLSTGYHYLDRLLGGYRRDQLIILAGRPGMGKTSLGLCQAIRQSMDGEPTAFFSLEMGREELIERAVAVVSGVDNGRIRSGRLTDADWQEIYRATDAINQAPLFIDDTAAIKPAYLRASARQIKRRHGLKAVYVDYVQLMRPDERQDSREQVIGSISRNLKGIAKDLEIPVIAMAQLNRELEKRPNKRPMLSDLRESGSLEQDADVAIFLYNQAYYQAGGKHERASETDCIVAKNRAGACGTVPLWYVPENTAFHDMDLRQ